MSMTTGTNQDQTRFAHRATEPRPELLGMLITRRSSDSATGKGALGALAYMGSRFISAQIGRVIRPASLVAANKSVALIGVFCIQQQCLQPVVATATSWLGN
jgi:hypothetical protein